MLQLSHNIGRYVNKNGELVHDTVYLNLFASFKQWYTRYGLFFKEKQLSG